MNSTQQRTPLKAENPEPLRDVRASAIAAFKTQQTEESETENVRLQKRAELLQEKLLKLGIQTVIDENYNCVVFDDTVFDYSPCPIPGEHLPDSIIFTYVYNYNGRYDFIGILGTCPKCNQTVPSVAITNLIDVGAQLTQFKPDFSHECPVNPKSSNSPEQRLLAALRDLIGNQLPE